MLTKTLTNGSCSWVSRWELTQNTTDARCTSTKKEKSFRLEMSSVFNCSRKRLNLNKCDRKTSRKTKLASRHSDKRFTGKSTMTNLKSRLTLRIDSEKCSLTLKWCLRTWRKKCVKESSSNTNRDSINSPKVATKKYGTCKPNKLKSARFKSTKN